MYTCIVKGHLVMAFLKSVRHRIAISFLGDSLLYHLVWRALYLNTNTGILGNRRKLKKLIRKPC